jgi:hypothetical protein
MDQAGEGLGQGGAVRILLGFEDSLNHRRGRRFRL